MNPASSAFSVRWDIFLLTLGMCLVTYIPRALPALFGGRLRLQPWAQRFLNLIPCAALTALIFPGILNTDPARPWIGIAGGIAAALLAWRRSSPGGAARCWSACWRRSGWILYCIPFCPDGQ